VPHPEKVTGMTVILSTVLNTIMDGLGFVYSALSFKCTLGLFDVGRIVCKTCYDEVTVHYVTPSETVAFFHEFLFCFQPVLKTVTGFP
jgi:hypothetical protein